MTKAESRALFLRHLGEADTANSGDISDLTDRHDHLIGSAVAAVGAALRTGARWLIDPGAGNVSGGWRVCPLPGDFVALCGTERQIEGRWTPCEGAETEPGGLRLPDSWREPVAVHYVRRPAALLPVAPDDTPLDLPEKAVHLAPLRCAATAVQATSPALSAYLMDMYTHEMGAIGGQGLPMQAAVSARYRMEV